MTPDRLRECLHLLRWSLRDLAAALGIDDRQVRRWGAGSAAVPPAIAAWIEVLAAAHAANPPPSRPAWQPEGDAE